MATWGVPGHSTTEQDPISKEVSIGNMIQKEKQERTGERQKTNSKVAANYTNDYIKYK